MVCVGAGVVVVTRKVGDEEIGVLRLAGEVLLDTDQRGAALALGVQAADDVAGTCLLYTSPSPRDRQKSRMPSSA